MNKLVQEAGIDSRGEFRTGDVLDLLSDTQSQSQKFRLIISSPPYNIGKSYEKDSKKSLTEYLEWQGKIIDKIYEILEDDGSVCWQVGNYIKDGEIIPLDGPFIDLFRKKNLKLRNRIIWRFNFGLNADRKFSGRYETLLWFTKTDNYIFNLDPVRIPQIYPGKRHSRKKGEAKAGRPSGNPLGKNPSDFWEFLPETDFLDNPIWDIPNVKANHPEKTDHPCQFPIELAERCILALTQVDDFVLDPFVGTGASVLAAVKHQRKALGFDKDPGFLTTANKRKLALERGELPMRPLGQPVRRPRSTERVSQVPAEWQLTSDRSDS